VRSNPSHIVHRTPRCPLQSFRSWRSMSWGTSLCCNQCHQGAQHRGRYIGLLHLVQYIDVGLQYCNVRVGNIVVTVHDFFTERKSWITGYHEIRQMMWHMNTMLQNAHSQS
jgi:hypothetical protein